MTNRNAASFRGILPVLLSLLVAFAVAGCSGGNASSTNAAAVSQGSAVTQEAASEQSRGSISSDDSSAPGGVSQDSGTRDGASSTMPVYNGQPYAVIEDGVPSFTAEELSSPYGTEVYGELDKLGRCTYAFAIVGPETEPAPGEKRGSISEVKPTGWRQAFYKEEIGLEHLYERSHLIAWRLTAENANPRNLITGTVYMNSFTMVQFEEEIDNYVDGTGGHVAMRVTPYFRGDNLVADGVRIEALSLEDDGRSVSIDVFCFNVQPNVSIDYATGASSVVTQAKPATTDSGDSAKSHYVLNTNTRKFHVQGCSSVNQMKEKNRQEIDAARADVINMGYDPCGNCKP